MKNLVKIAAENTIKDLKTLLVQKRDNDQDNFKEIYNEVSKMHDILQIDIEKPRTITIKQIHRDNYQSNTPEDLFRVSIYNQCLDEVICNLTDRFNQNYFKNLYINELTPKIIIQKSKEEADFLGRQMNILKPFHK